jgi:hypothetical protein
MKAAGFKVAAWVDEMLAAGNKSFIKLKMVSGSAMTLVAKRTSSYRR